MASSHQVGVLVPLNSNLEEDETSSSRLPVFEGDNAVGRSNISVADKRLSRKHLTLSVSADGSADVLVEGMNPIVVNSDNRRMKLGFREEATIRNGDIFELVPGEYFFRYEINKQNSLPTNKENETRNEWSNVGVSKKRKVPEPGNDAVTGSLQTDQKNGSKQQEVSSIIHFGSSQSKRQNVSDNLEEAICQFNVTREKLPLTFQLMRVQGLPPWANTSSVSIGDVIKGNVLFAVLSNYMVDLDWLLPACPTLKKVPHVLVVHGEGDGTLEHMKKTKPTNWILHKPPLPISYGTHHSKAMLLVYPKGVRVIVHTANLIYVDWSNKSQGLWMQDFPWKDENDSSKVCGFESDLVDYLNALKLPEFTVDLPSLGSFKINASFFKKFDYGSAVVRLIASVPGYHSGPNLRKWGHMKLSSVLEQCTFSKEFQKSPLVYQFSSLGSLDEKWMAELKSSMSSGSSDDKTPLGLGEPLIIWPTVEDVRCSLEGYAAGNAIPSPLKNVEKQFLKKYWAKWKATHTGRCRAMPHIKTFARYNGQNIAWFLLTSANLSKAAWGALQKNNTQLMIRSYELGVLFLPSSLKKGCGFSCTDDRDVLWDKKPLDSGTRKTKLVTLTWQGNVDSKVELVRLPLPYELPPQLYSREGHNSVLDNLFMLCTFLITVLPACHAFSYGVLYISFPLFTVADVPWSWDRGYQKKDVYGQV
ncbi:hypothetical protein Dimus_032903 [Dionaea muscipula]